MSASRLAQQRLERANARGGSSSFQRENSAYGAFYPGAGSVSKKAAGPGESPAPTAWNPHNSVPRPSNQSYGGFYDGGDGSGQAEPKKGGRFTPLRGTMEPTAQSPQQKIAQSRPGDYSEAGGGMALRQQQNQGSCMDVDSYLRKNSTAAVEQPAKQVAYSRLSTGAEQIADANWKSFGQPRSTAPNRREEDHFHGGSIILDRSLPAHAFQDDYASWHGIQADGAAHADDHFTGASMNLATHHRRGSTLDPGMNGGKKVNHSAAGSVDHMLNGAGMQVSTQASTHGVGGSVHTGQRSYADERATDHFEGYGMNIDRSEQPTFNEKEINHNAVDHFKGGMRIGEGAKEISHGGVATYLDTSGDHFSGGAMIMDPNNQDYSCSGGKKSSNDATQEDDHFAVHGGMNISDQVEDIGLVNVYGHVVNHSKNAGGSTTDHFEGGQLNIDDTDTVEVQGRAHFGAGEHLATKNHLQGSGGVASSGGITGLISVSGAKANHLGHAKTAKGGVHKAQIDHFEHMSEIRPGTEADHYNMPHLHQKDLQQALEGASMQVSAAAQSTEATTIGGDRVYHSSLAKQRTIEHLEGTSLNPGGAIKDSGFQYDVDLRGSIRH